MEVNMQDLISTGAHFGHQSKYWNPNMKKHISATYNHIHIINLEHTLTGLRKACEFVHNLAKNRNKLLLVGTKRAASDIIKEQAMTINQFYVNHRWMGGMLTNYKTVCSSIDKLKELTKESQDGTWNKLTKKEALTRRNLMNKLEKSIGGIKDMDGLPDALFVVDIRREQIAVMEAKKLGIPVIAIVDTNSNPKHADYVIPANDDSIRAIKLYVSTIVSAFNDGMKLADELSMKRKTQKEPAAPPAETTRVEGTLKKKSQSPTKDEDDEDGKEATEATEYKEDKKDKEDREPKQDKEAMQDTNDTKDTKNTKETKQQGTAISADKVKELRRQTGVGIMECKEMLQQAGGDMEAAADLLRKAGRVKALKKTDRTTEEGLFIAEVSDGVASLIEINCETDFVARNEELAELGRKLLVESQSKQAQNTDDVLVAGEPLEEEFQQLVHKLGENIQVTGFTHLDAPEGGTVSAYVHSNQRIGVLVAIDKDNAELCHDLALQVAAMDPIAATPDEIPAEIIQKEQDIYQEQVKDSGKPPEVQEKMIKGMLDKFKTNNSLSGQAFIKDTQTKVASLLSEAGVTHISFIRRELGQQASSSS